MVCSLDLLTCITDLLQDLVRKGQNRYQARQTSDAFVSQHVDILPAGLSDKEIEDKVASMVKTELS